MADKIVLIDTSILIDLFRRTDKANSTLMTLVQQGYMYCISAITEYEIYTGAASTQIRFWDTKYWPLIKPWLKLPLKLTAT